MAKDWTGNKHSVFVTLGASNHTDHERAEHDYYATDPIAADLLCDVEVFHGAIWENACGAGHLSKQLEKHGYTVISTDLINRGYGESGVDFFQCTHTLAPNIVTNPPYSCSVEWAEHALELLPKGGKLALFLPIQFLESDRRRELFSKYPIKTVYSCVRRVLCAMNGQFYQVDEQGNYKLNKDGSPKKMSSAKHYAWFVWEKGYSGVTELKFIN